MWYGLATVATLLSQDWCPWPRRKMAIFHTKERHLVSSICAMRDPLPFSWGRVKAQGPQVWVLARVCPCANICSWTKQYWEALWACFQMKSRAIKRGTEPAPLLSKGPLRKTPVFYRQLNTGYLVEPFPNLHSVHIPLSCDKPISSLYISVRHV